MLKSPWKYLIILICSSIFILLPKDIWAQTTKVKGRVVDVDTGEGIAFVGVYFKNSTVGTTTDMDGYYILQSRDTTLKYLSASILGYDSQEARVQVGNFNEINFSLKSITTSLDAAVIKPDDRYMRWILSKIDENRSKNNPLDRERYDSEVYTKLEVGITNAEEGFSGTFVDKKMGFVFDYMDTSVVSGQPYLPIMISETSSHIFYQKDPKMSKEMVHGSRISGVKNESTVAQFTGKMLVQVNFYDNFVNIMDVEIPSPLSSSGMVYYNYYLIDSLDIKGRKNYHIRFHPKKMYIIPLVFDGEMNIDAEDFAFRDIHVALTKKSNVNWVRDLVIDFENDLVENKATKDSVWFSKQDKMYIDFSPVKTDSTNIMTFIAKDR